MIMTGRYTILIFLFVVASSSLLSAKVGLGQERDPHKVMLSLSADQAALEAVFHAIEKQTPFRFFYDANSIDTRQPVTLHMRRRSVAQVLQYLAGVTGLEFKLIDHYYSVRPRAAGRALEALEPHAVLKLPERVMPERHWSQLVADTLVRGRVLDEQGQPLIGVSIQVKGSTGGTVTAADGVFELEAPARATLVFSYVGYETQERPLFPAFDPTITLAPSASGLNEVVVVGYGTQKKSVVTGAISSIKAADLENQQIARLEQALQGRGSGLTIASSSGAPGAASTVRIRGITSLNEGASNPLYVVDGVVIGTGGIDYLNPSDIASIEVLKDAASAAIYGARSSAGVILVSTKSGRAGSGVRVQYNGYYGIQAPAKKLKLLDATGYAMMRNEQELNDGRDPVFADPASLGKGTDWQDQIFNHHARIQQHEISISGGSEKSTFYTSFGYYDQQGIVATEISGYKRYNIRLNATHRLASWLRFGETLGYSHVRSMGGTPGNTDFGGPLSSAIMLDPITPVVITDPEEAAQVPYSSQPVVRDEHGNPYGISPYVVQQVTNPLAYIHTRHGNYSWSDDIVGNAFLEAEPLKGLKIRSTIGTQLSYWGSESFTPLYYLNSNQLSTQTSFTRDRQRSLDWNLENTLSYTHTVDLHHFTLLLGQGAYLNNNSSGITVTYFNLPVDNFEDASMNYSVSADDKSAEGHEGVHHTVSSLFTRLSYDYAGKYIFTGVLRRDGSSRFGANHQYGYFPSASVGWVASQEGFWPSGARVNFLKLRASYGITGNDVLGDFRYLATVGGGRNYTLGNDLLEIGYSPDAPSNPDLKWEQTSQLDFGLDMVFWQHWNLTLDWFDKKTSGILQAIEFPGYVGATGTSYGNVADMSNTGIELELGFDRQMGDLHLQVKGNISYLQNEVTYLGEGKAYLEGGATLQSSTYALTRTAVGHPIGSFFGFVSDGIFQNAKEVESYTGPDGTPIQPDALPGDFRWKDLNHDGKISQEDRTFIGDPTPNWSYGTTLALGYKAFDLLVFGQGVSGNEIFQGLRRLDIPTANWQTSVLDRWHGEGSSHTYPRLTAKDPNKNYANPSGFHLRRGNYFRIKTFQVGYTLPTHLIAKAGLQSARVYLSSNNLLTITRYPGFDPEIGGSSYGIDRAIYPQARSFLLGLHLGF